MSKLNKIQFLGVGITSDNEERILEYIYSSLRRDSKKYYIVTPNPEIIVHAVDHADYKKIINEAEIALPDGVGLFIAAGLSGKIIKQRITGVDFMETLCKYSENRPITVGFLGGMDGVAEKTADCLASRYPWLKIVFVAEEWGENGFKNAEKYQVSGIKHQENSSKIIHDTKYMIHNTLIDILFVAFGHPKQEEWIYNNLDKLPVRIAMGVGGAFDYVSGYKKRAPFMIRAMGFEWLYRLIKEPWRWRRQLALLKFIWLFIKSLFIHSK